MVCISLGSLLRPLFYFLCYIHFSLSVVAIFCPADRSSSFGIRFLCICVFAQPINVWTVTRIAERRGSKWGKEEEGKKGNVGKCPMLPHHKTLWTFLSKITTLLQF